MVDWIKLAHYRFRRILFSNQIVILHGEAPYLALNCFVSFFMSQLFAFI